MDEKVLKTIGFPLRMLKIIDTYAYQNNISRADVVRKAVSEFIKKYEIESLANS